MSAPAMLPTDQNATQKVVGNASEKLYLVRRRHHFNGLLDGELRVIP